jgi:putative ABC transport system permease protein
MYVTVTERTREIGLKKSIGAPANIILAEFIIESIIVTLIGGFLGILWGIFVSWLVSVVAGLFSFQWPFIIALNGVLLALAVSGGIGLIFGYAPARKAARLNPIEALRYE